MHNNKKISNLLFKIGFFLLFLSKAIPSFATHIVGGELNYTHVSGDNYEISLTIFRDCYNANPNVFFDDTVSIGVYDPVLNFLVEDIRIPFDTLLNDTLNPVLYNDCLIIPPNVCVHTTVYKDTIELIYNPNGYVLTYQRCCRNGTISNIIAPLETGATFSVFISPKALEIKNSSPKFQSWPPVYICADFPINYDQSALDLDLDSIAYKLCTPLKGGGPPPNGNPIPQPPAPPPYEQVEWFDPPYNQLNMLNAFPGNPLEISPITGLLTGTPNTIGQFVVGICLEEFRNDTLISTIRRDFQYNVGLCGNPTSSFFTPEIHCSTDSVFFSNESSNANDFLWTFDLENNPQITSTAFAPSFLYEEYGTYTVQLISEPFTICADTFIQNVTVVPAGMNPEIEFEVIECGEFYEIQFTAVPNSFGSEPQDFTWIFDDNTIITFENPYIAFANDAGFIEVTLLITGSEGCVYEANTIIYLNGIEETLDIEETSICVGDTITANSSYSLNYDYQWSPNTNISSTAHPNPQFFPDTSTLYTLSITDNIGCEKSLNLFIEVFDRPSFSLADTSIICSDEILLNVEPTTVNYIWTADLQQNDTLGINQDLNVLVADNETVYIHSFDSPNNCNSTDSIQIFNQSITFTEDIPDEIICPGEELLVELNSIVSNYDTVIWNTSSAFVLTQNDSTLEYLSLTPGWDTLSIQLENTYGCELIDSFAVYLYEQASYPNYSLSDCGILLQEFFPQIEGTELMAWNFGDDNNQYNFNAGEQISHLYSEAGSYTASYWIPALEACADTVYIPVNIEETVTDYGIDYEITNCISNLELSLGAYFESITYSLDSAIWSINGSHYIGTNLDLILEDSSNLSLVLYYNDGCTLDLEDQISWFSPSIYEADTLSICKGDQINIGINPSGSQTVQWLPNEVFDGSSQDSIQLSLEESTYFIAAITSSIGSSECIAYDTLFVEVFEETQLSLDYERASCTEALFTFSTNDASLFEEVNWTYMDSIYSNQSNLALEITNYEEQIFIQAIDLNECPITDTLSLESYLLENKDTILRPCFPDESTFEFDVDNSLLYNWYSDGSDFTEEINSITMPFSEDASYFLTRTDPWGCMDTLSIQLNGFNELANLELLTDADTILAGELVTVESNLTDLIIYEFIFNNFVYLQTDYSLTFPLEEHTTVSLEVFDINGCTANAEITITVLDPKCDLPYVFIPNTFTPNGDEENDHFKVEGNFIEKVEISIYDRWGEKVFFTENKDEHWDGTYKNKLLDSDTYAYHIKLECIGGEKRILKGNVSLIR